MDPVYHQVVSNSSALKNSNTFQDYIVTLPTWSHSYLVGIKWLLSLDQLIQHFQESKVEYATDSSAKDNIGSYSWILSTGGGSRLATNTWESAGKDHYSFQSESQDTLSVLLFHYHFSVFLKLTLPEVTMVHTDNRSFITR